jgi:hypothetical protein
MTTTFRPYAIVNSAPIPQSVFTLDGYIVLQNGQTIGTYQVYNENPEILNQTYTQGAGETFTSDPQPLKIDPNVAILNVALKNINGTLGSAGSDVRSGFDLQSSTLSTATLDLGASGTDNFYTGMYIGIISTGDIRLITAYDGTTKVATVSPNFSSSPGAVAYIIANNVSTLRVGRSNDDGTPLTLDQSFGLAQGVYNVNNDIFVQPTTTVTNASGLVVLRIATDNITTGATLSVRLVCINA